MITTVMEHNLHGWCTIPSGFPPSLMPSTWFKLTKHYDLPDFCDVARRIWSGLREETSSSAVHPLHFQYQLGLCHWENCIVATLLSFN